MKLPNIHLSSVRNTHLPLETSLIMGNKIENKPKEDTDFHYLRD